MKCPVVVKIIRSDNKSLIIDGTDWIIPSKGLDGFGEVGNDLSSVDKSAGDGSVVVSKRVDSLNREIKAYVTDARLNQTLRYRATSFFNGKYTFKIYVTYMGRTRWCEGEIKKFFCPTQNIYERVFFSVTFYCADPFMKSAENFGKNIAGVTPMVAFPYLCGVAEQPTSGRNHIVGRATGRYNFTRHVELYNDGDVEAYCKAIFVAKGNVKNPKLVINDKYVRVLIDMVQDDILVIDFIHNPPTVRLNGQNIIGKTDRTSNFTDMQLNIGDTIISFDADEGNGLLDVSIYYNKLYNMI